MSDERVEPQPQHATVIPAGPDDVQSSSLASASAAHDPIADAKADANTDANATFVMPGPDPAEKIAAISPEGVPADAHAGPAALRSLLLVFVAIIVVAAGVSVIWIGWAGAAVVLVVGLASVLINPAMGATWSRAKERQEIIVIDKLRAQGIDENQDNVLSEPPGTAIPALPALTAHDDRRHP